MLTKEKISPFARDTLKGLTAKNKYLLPKYFYDQKGSRIFQQIMRMPEYYPTDCEMEIFSQQGTIIAKSIVPAQGHFEMIELGSGDGLKTKLLLKSLMKMHLSFTYTPVDISPHALDELGSDLEKQFPGINIKKKAGDFFPIMKDLSAQNGTPKVLLFLGSNIGNFMSEERDVFLKLLSAMTSPGDKVLIGFDQKKSPEIISGAYDDPAGHTRAFNLNHLQRINHELDANFNLSQFYHHTSYNPITGAMKSYLLSKIEQTVTLGALNEKIFFGKWEPIFMELSQKFNYDDIHLLAREYGFKVSRNFTDDKNYFTDSLWIKT
ncbi:MAG: L-histidine N(alpha)-methyltransferase [bacterium]